MKKKTTVDCECHQNNKKKDTTNEQTNEKKETPTSFGV